MPLLKIRALKNFDELAEKLSKSPSDSLLQEFINCLTNNKTDFFRDDNHFIFLKSHLPILLQGKTKLRIWSSACSYGAEPLSIAMQAREILSPEDFRKVKILATDIDTEALEKAQKGLFTATEIKELEPAVKQKYFKIDRFNTYQVDSEISSAVQFSQFNLTQYKYEFKKKFDLILCRNVLIYFDQETMNKVLDMLVSNLELSGFLIIGHSESGGLHHPCLKSAGHSIFQKVRK